VSQSEIVKRPSSSLKDKGQFAVAFSLIGVLLYVAGFPLFFLIFVGVLTYLVWKIFSSESRSDARKIFEFYLSANEILRDDHRRWYGFEINETIAFGERIVRAVPNSPPLVHFALGALYERMNDHSSSIKHLSYISEEAGVEEGIVFPSSDLREYVRILRKIERSPAEAPQTSAAVRSLERLRKNRTKALLDKARSLEKPGESGDQRDLNVQPRAELHNVDEFRDPSAHPGSVTDPVPLIVVQEKSERDLRTKRDGGRQNVDPNGPDRKTISEVLHDIYDGNIQ
jgi:hypothetical protein